jgi:phthalate 4,5-dioxygenase
MLSQVENEMLTQVGPGTAMGELLRRFWIPALPIADIAEPNGDPVRVRLVGENFVAWRDQAGRLGFFDEYCMHRGASLALGRCEGDGLRCLYHGWKYAIDGTILETPNFKRSTLKERLKAPVYPTREAGGFVWVYLGPKDKEPPFPHYKFMDNDPDGEPIYTIFFNATFDCNFVQAMEGTMDPSHPHILHQDPDKLGKSYALEADAKYGWNGYVSDVKATSFISEDTAPECEVEDTLFGCHGVAIHDAIADGEPTFYGRVHTFVMPFLIMPSNESFVFTVPLDDHHSRLFGLLILTDENREKFLAKQFGPASHYEDGHYRWTEKERWGQDRSKMGESYTGVAGIVPEDIAVCLSMGPVQDRTKEHVVPADRMIIRSRRRLLQTAQALQEGTEPYMLQPEDAYCLGGSKSLVPDPANWREVLVPQIEPFRITGKSSTDDATIGSAS